MSMVQRRLYRRNRRQLLCADELPVRDPPTPDGHGDVSADTVLRDELMRGRDDPIGLYQSWFMPLSARVVKHADRVI